MEPMTAGQVRRLIELTEGLGRDTIQQWLEDPETLTGVLKAGPGKFKEIYHAQPGKPLTLTDAKKLGFLIVAPRDVNKEFGTSLNLKTCPIGFTKEQAKAFVDRAKADFKTDQPPIGLFLLTDKDGQGNQIDLLYLKKHFPKLYSDWYVQEEKTDFKNQVIRQMWVMTYWQTNPAYVNKTWSRTAGTFYETSGANIVCSRRSILSVNGRESYR